MIALWGFTLPKFNSQAGGLLFIFYLFYNLSRGCINFNGLSVCPLARFYISFIVANEIAVATI